MARLNQDQLNSLRTALQGKGIVYQEVKDELLDHIASEVEAEMAQGESFYSATKKAFIRFGPNELNKIQRAFKRSLTKNAWQLAWAHYKSYMTSWKISIHLPIIAGLWFMQNWANNALELTWFLSWWILLGFSIGIYYWFRRNVHLKSYRETAWNLMIGTYNFNLLLLVAITSGFFGLFEASKGSLLIFQYLTVFSHLVLLESLFTLKQKWLRMKLCC